MRLFGENSPVKTEYENGSLSFVELFPHDSNKVELLRSLEKGKTKFTRSEHLLLAEIDETFDIPLVRALQARTILKKFILSCEYDYTHLFRHIFKHLSKNNKPFLFNFKSCENSS